MNILLQKELNGTTARLNYLYSGVADVRIATGSGVTSLVDVADMRLEMMRDLAGHNLTARVWVVNFEDALLTYPGQRLSEVLRGHRPKHAAPEPTALVVRIEDARDFQDYARQLQSAGLDRIIFSAPQRVKALLWARAVLGSQAVQQRDAPPTESAHSR